MGTLRAKFFGFLSTPGVYVIPGLPESLEDRRDVGVGRGWG